MKGRRLSLVVLAVLVMLVFGGQALFAGRLGGEEGKNLRVFHPAPRQLIHGGAGAEHD